MTASVAKKTVKATFLDNFRSSCEIFSSFSEQPFCKALLVSCFSHLLKSSSWMTTTYFFFDTYVFSEYFSLGSELLLNCVEKTLWWRLQTCLFAFTEKNISLFGGELLLRKLLIQSVIEFLENCDQNSLDSVNRPIITAILISLASVILK